MATDFSHRTEIIIATLAEVSRGAQLIRAIESVLIQRAGVIVVINGARYDSSLRSRLEEMPGIRLIYIEQSGFPNAVYVGRCAVKSEYFGFLDDDDYLLPGSIATREAYLDASPQTDVVVTNGFREEWKDDQRLFKSKNDLQLISSDPMAALLQANWMTPCGPLYRQESIPLDLFLDLTKYAEWTDVGFRLIGNYRVGFMFDATFVQTDTPGSLSKQRGQAHFIIGLHLKIAGKVCTVEQRRLWNLRICNLHHQLAEEELKMNNWRKAMKHHLNSLLHAPKIGFTRYFLYTTRILSWPVCSFFARLVPKSIN